MKISELAERLCTISRDAKDERKEVEDAIERIATEKETAMKVAVGRMLETLRCEWTQAIKPAVEFRTRSIRELLESKGVDDMVRSTVTSNLALLAGDLGEVLADVLRKAVNDN